MHLVILIGVSIFFLIIGIIERNAGIIIPSMVGLMAGLVEAYKAIKKK